MLSKHIKEYTFTIFDTETTGGASDDELIEISAIKIKPELLLDLTDTFSHLIKPSKRINEYGFAYKINKISNKMVENAPKVTDVIPKFLEFSQGSVIVAHNTPFDMRFLNKAAAMCNLQCDYIHKLDTIHLAKKAFPNLPNYKLDTLIEAMNLDISIENSHRHRAMYDCLNTAYIFIECIKIFLSKGHFELRNIK